MTVPRSIVDAIHRNCDPDEILLLAKYDNANTTSYDNFYQESFLAEQIMNQTHRVVTFKVLPAMSFELIGTFPLGLVDEMHNTCGALNGYKTYYAPPKFQLEHNVEPMKVKCNDELVLLQKYDGTPACVKESTKKKLIERGWTETQTKNESSDLGQLKGVLGSCSCQERTNANPNTIERCPSIEKIWQNSTHYIDNNSCRWVYLEKYLDDNNELNFAQPYDNNGMIIDDLQRIYDWCDYSGEKPDWYFDWNNQTHHIDSKQCKWYGCDNGEIYFRGVCMTPEAKEKAQSIGEIENEN